MYRWRQLTLPQRKELLSLRQFRHYPWHAPPHSDGAGVYHLTAANFNHQIILGNSWQRMAEFENEILENLTRISASILAWCILPNHYHLLLETDKLESAVHSIGRLHGQTSRHWNIVDDTLGRKCWFHCSDRLMRSYRHRMATLNYIHHNPVHHHCSKRWQDWPFSSAENFLKATGRTQAISIWETYPVDDYGRGWDDWQADDQ
jgi:REP element-mobilizing transposase RayT